MNGISGTDAYGPFAGFGVRGYRSFGDPRAIARFGPMGKVHLVVGQNNVGKSNTLHFMADVLAELRRGGGQVDIAKLFPGSFDEPEGWSDPGGRVISIALALTDEVKKALHFGNDAVRAWLTTDAYTRGEADIVWLDLTLRPRPNQAKTLELMLSMEQAEQAAAEASGFDMGSLAGISGALTHSSGGAEHNLQSILRVWAPWRFIPETVWLDAVREITATGDEDLRTGRGIIPRLAKLERPSRENYQDDRTRFEGLESFVRDVLEDADARIEIPEDKSTILIHGKFGMRELGHVGTGVGELILIAAVASINRNVLICIEEPEIHLHPTLQRKLIAYLDSATQNRYLISTHSAAMLNAEIATISHIETSEGWSVVSRVVTSRHLAQVASDLGNRASDLVQSNYVIWVEGPSDRLYVAAWLRAIDQELVEGAHYSIMFYGGALLSHLSVDDQELGDFINLLRINRNLAVVIDSDRSEQRAPLNATKTRVIGEVEKIDAIAWVTEGYTIENYVARANLTEAIEALYPNHTYRMPRGDFRSPLGAKFVGSESRPSKTSVARHVIAQGIDASSLPTGLVDTVQALAVEIRKANGLDLLEYS